MATVKALDRRPHAGNPRARFDEGEVAPAATPRRGVLLCKNRTIAFLLTLVSLGALADALSVTPAVPYSRRTRGFWLQRFDQKKAMAAEGGYPIVFVGDSITHNWETSGFGVWTNNYAEGRYRALNVGFSGDRT